MVRGAGTGETVGRACAFGIPVKPSTLTLVTLGGADLQQQSFPGDVARGPLVPPVPEITPAAASR
jgi:hypothetical protein